MRSVTAVSRRPPAKLNLYEERSRLTREQLARWQGLPFCWVDASPKVRVRNTSMPRPALALLEAGAAEAEFGFPTRTQRLNLCAGAIGLFDAGEKRFSHWTSFEARRIVVDLDMQHLISSGLAADELLATPLRENLEFRDAELALVLLAMADEVVQGCPHGRLYAQSLSLGIALRLVDNHGIRSAGPRERGRLTARQLRRVDELIEANLAGDLPLPNLAAAAGFSAAQFTRLLRNTVGCTPHRYVMRRRVERACEMLVRSDVPLSAIAAATGFATQSHMNAVLRRSVGSTPGQVRRERAR